MLVLPQRCLWRMAPIRPGREGSEEAVGALHRAWFWFLRVVGGVAWAMI